MTTIAAPVISGNAQKTSRRFLGTVTPTAGNFDLDVSGASFGTSRNSKVILADKDQLHLATLTYNGITQTTTPTKITSRFTGVTAGTYYAYVEVENVGFAAPQG